MPGVICAPGNFDEGKNHEKLSLRHWPDRAVSVEGDFGLEHLGLRRGRAGVNWRGEGVLCVAQPRGPGRVNRGCG